jgi:3,4-dihydroxy 2-butanone 4-phosphate synthase/GTP cyclohydrolase II
MFTGIIQFVFKVKIDNYYVYLFPDTKFLSMISIGDSISIDGVCLTVCGIYDNHCVFQITDETISKTNLKYQLERLANVELAIKYGSFLGGHVVSGHVHQTAKLVSFSNDGNVWIEFSNDINQLAHYKDSIAINGVSLTIAEINGNMIRIALIPETIKKTNFCCIQPNDIVNVEFNLPLYHHELHDDVYFMRMAIKEGEKGRFTAAPNPWVGCVVVKNGVVVGQGHHVRPGEGHAEVNAINSCSVDVTGATMYVTLEPCCHYGRTPPCTKLLIEHKIAKVIIGITDPDHKVNNKGINELKNAGIDVLLMQDINMLVYNEVKHSLRQYLYHRINKRPYCTVKIALSADNCFRDMEGISKWITHEESRKEGHLLRASCQAIVVGALTVQQDDPELTARYGIKLDKQPTKIVLDGDSLTTTNRKLFNNNNETIIITQNENKWTNNKYIISSTNPIDVDNILTNMGYIHYLIEGGAKTQKSFCDARLVNEIVVFRGSKMFGQEGYQWLMPANMKLSLVESKMIPCNGVNDVMERYLVDYVDHIGSPKCNPMFAFDDVQLAINTFANGGFVLVMDDEKRENEGDLMVAACKMTESQMTELINHTTGIICVPMERSRAKKLNLPLMCANNTDIMKTAFTITVDAVGTTTGVSCKDRLLTAHMLANDQTISNDLRRPGHMFPLIAHPKGFNARKGHTEAAIALCKLGNIYPRVAVIAEMQNKDGTMKRGQQCYQYAKSNNIPMISTQQLINVINKIQTPKLLASCNLQSKIGEFEWRALCFDSGDINKPHKVFIYPKSGLDHDMVIPVRIHSECFTGDVFKSSHCDCGKQLKLSMQYIVNNGCGIVIFPSDHEGRGIGIMQKVKAYHLQQKLNIDTLVANQHLGLDIDARTYDDVVGILEQLGISKVELLTENPDKIESLGDIVMKTTALTAMDGYNEKYLTTKKNYFMTKLKQDVPLVKGSDPIIVLDGIDASKLKIALVYSMWHDTYIGQIRDILKGHLNHCGVVDIDEFAVPGSNEVPFKAANIAGQFDSIICIGILIKGDTLHFENVSGAVSDGIMQAQIKTGVPMINCILSCLNMEQVVDRITGTKSTLEYIAKSAIYMTK